MAHLIGERDIQTGVKPAWHDKTNVVKFVTRENSGIDYGMITVPLFFEHDHKKISVNAKQIISLDDNLPIGIPVGNDYELISNSQIWDVVEESLTGTKHKVVSAGTVMGREIGFISIELDGNFMAGGRKTESVLNFLFGHGGKLAFTVKTGMTVVVCANTFQMAMKDRGDFKLKIKHTKNSRNKIDNIPQVIDAHFGVRAEFEKAMDELSNISVTETKAREIITGIIAPPEIEQLSTRSVNQIDRTVSLFRHGAGSNGDDLCDVFNGITDYYTHESAGQNKWKQYVSSDFGAAQKVKERAYSILTQADDRNEAAKRGAKLIKVGY